MVHEQGLELPPDHDLVLWLEWRRISQSGYNWIYYFVDHSKQTLFWIEDYDPVTTLDMDEVLALNSPYDISMFLVISPGRGSSRLQSMNCMQDTGKPTPRPLDELSCLSLS